MDDSSLLVHICPVEPGTVVGRRIQVLSCSHSHSSLLNLFPSFVAFSKSSILCGLFCEFNIYYLVVRSLDFSWKVHGCSSSGALALQGLSFVLLYLEVATTLASEHG